MQVAREGEWCVCAYAGVMLWCLLCVWGGGGQGGVPREGVPVGIVDLLKEPKPVRGVVAVGRGGCDFRRRGHLARPWSIETRS